MSIIEKLGIKIDENGNYFFKNEDIYQSARGTAPEMLEALIEACQLYEYSMKVKYARHGVGHEDYHRAKNQFEKTMDVIQKATGKQWEEIKELIE